MRLVPPYGAQPAYSSYNVYPQAAYPITPFGAAMASYTGPVAPLANIIKASKVRTPEDLAAVSSQILDAIKLETGSAESAGKYTSLASDSAAATTIPKQVAVLQRLAALTLKKGATQTNDAIRNGVAYDYWCNVESPGACASAKPKSEVVKEMEKTMLVVPWYQQPAVQWGGIAVGSIVAIGVIGSFLFGGGDDEEGIEEEAAPDATIPLAANPDVLAALGL
tara:strand:+ start:1552 stop:2217 length:666 start_codon:yes stop_codon:yes gene_type:complete